MASTKEDEDVVVVGKHIGNHIGCMAGLFHIFDRTHILSHKRFSSPKPLLPPPLLSEPSSHNSSPLIPCAFGNHQQQSRSSTPELRSPAPESLPGNLTTSPLTIPVFEFKDGSRSPWKFSKEAPRLSLDSRAVFDGKGSLKPRQLRSDSGSLPADPRDSTDGVSQRRSPSVIARLMGLEPLPSSDPEQPQKVELRRSASESRVNREYRFVDGLNFQAQRSQNLQTSLPSNAYGHEDERTNTNGDEDPRESPVRSARTQPAKATPHQRCVVRRKSVFDSAEFLSEPKQNESVPGDIEKKIRMRGVDELPSDLETLKQLLETIRLKGLLHSSNNQRSRIGNKNFVFDNREHPVKQGGSPAHIRRSRESSPFGVRSGTAGVGSPSVSPRRDRGASSPRDQDRGRSRSSQTTNEKSMKSPNGRASPRESREHQRRVSPTQSPKVATWGRPEPVLKTQRPNRSGGLKLHAQEDECSEEVEEYKRERKNVLERCEKLLHSIAEMTAAATESQPSPVSVLDSSLYHEESSPSPVMKRSLEFTDEASEWEDDETHIELDSDDESHFIYISHILRACHYLPHHSDVFSLLENQHFLNAKSPTHERRLIFDSVLEILSRRRRLQPWRAMGMSPVQQIWWELRKMRERRRYGWEEEEKVAVRREVEEEGEEAEKAEAVIDIERLIFKDLIVETIRELTWSRTQMPPTRGRRRLLF